MEKFKKSVLRKNRILKIILSSVIAIAMASFYMIGSSADSVVYLSKTISSEDFISLSYNNSYARFGYDNNTDLVISGIGPSSSVNYQITSLPYSPNIYHDSNSLYFSGVVFTNPDDSNGKRFSISLNTPFNLYFDNFTLDIYFLSLSSNFSVTYLDGDGNLVSPSFTSTNVASGTLSSLYNSTDYITDSYYNYLSSNLYFTKYDGTNGLNSLLNTYFQIYKISINFSGLNKTLINSIIISYSFSDYSTYLTYPRLAPYIYIDQDIKAYILSSQDEVYTQQLALAQQQNQMLEEITGDPDPTIQNEIDQAQSDQEQALHELQENVDTINEPTMPPEAELPTAPLDPEEAEEVYEDINTVFNLDGLNLFNILVPTGCVGFLIFTVMRRF